jgi:general L-amino acid transport system substrate-binding protein
MQAKRWLTLLVVCVLAMGMAACSTGDNQGAESQAADAPAESDAAEQDLGEAASDSDAEEQSEEPAVEAPPDEPAAEAQPEEPAQEPTAAGSLLQTVLDRETLVCGVNGQLPGFSVLNPEGDYEGFDVDFCRAVAAAVLGDANAVEFRPLTAQERFTALQTGEVDVLFRNTTWTLSRDTQNGLDFGPTTFYDGQGMLVLKEHGFVTLADLDGASICVQSGTTTEKNLGDSMREIGADYNPVVFTDPDQTFGAYDEGRCDAVTSDKSQLVSRQTTLAEPDAHEIMDVTLSKEPLGPAVLQGDAQWADVVNWTVLGVIQALEFGIGSQNLTDFMESDNPEIRRFLGLEDALGEGLGLQNDYMIKVIRQVGNFGEIYNRNLGPDTPFNLPRGPNQPWSDGGLLYSPPFR